MFISRKSTKNVRITDVFLDEKPLKWVPHHKYRGVLLNGFLKIDSDIKKNEVYLWKM